MRVLRDGQDPHRTDCQRAPRLPADEPCRPRVGAADVRLSVHNFGEPIPSELSEHIFDAFSRQRAAPQAGESWGLGLPLVRACAEAHGGKVAVESSPERGTTFTMTLPLDARPYQQ